MSELVELAKNRRQKVKTEIAKLDEFLSYAQKLLQEENRATGPTSSNAETRQATGDTGTKDTSEPASQSAQRSSAPDPDAPGRGKSSFFQKSSSCSD